MIIKDKDNSQSKKCLVAGQIFNNISINPNYTHVPFKANPIKHHRLQYNKSGSSTTLKQLNQPGSYVYDSKCTNCNYENCECGISFIDAKVLQHEKYNTCCPGYNEKINREQKNALTRVRNGYRKPPKMDNNNNKIYEYSGNNSVSSKYYVDTKSYLDNRNKLYENLQMIEKDLSGNAIVRACNCDDLSKTNAFYMCNRKYTLFTSVDSGARTSRIRYETINKNARSLGNIFGSNVANSVAYSNRTGVPFIIKVKKPQPCNKNKKHHKTNC